MYSSEIDGEATEFGTSGFLYQSNKLMYDRKTETLWHQFRGEPVVGPLAGSGIRLEVIPNALTTWGAWVADHPDTTVLSNDTGVYPADTYRPESDFRSFYYRYRNEARTMFPVAERDGRLATKDQVFGLIFNDSPKAYALADLAQSPVLNDTVGSQNVVIVTPDQGAGPRAYNRDSHAFQAAAPGVNGTFTLVDESGVAWRSEEGALVNTADNSQRLERLPSRDALWFGWFAFYPHTALHTP